MPETVQALAAAILMLLRPLVRILQRNGVPYGVFADLAKRTYIEVANEQFALPGRKPSVSRVSILTGLTRKEVVRVLDLPAVDNAAAIARYNRAARVIAGWVRDLDFCAPDGAPAELPLQGDKGSFMQLVKRYSGDMPARAMLDELARVGAVESRGEIVALLTPAYVPEHGEAEKFGILGRDVADLINTIDHNIYGAANSRRFQRKMAYDNLPGEDVGKLRAISVERAQALLEELDKRFAAADRDVNNKPGGSGRVRAGVGIYYFEENVLKEPR